MANEIIAFNELSQMATTMARSGMFGKTPDQMLSLMMIAQAESLHPAIAAMEYDIIQGRPALKGQAALARFQQSGGSIKWITRTEAEARAVFTHPQGGSLEISWTIERARKMALDQKDNWKKQPGTMLQWRCVSEGVRAVFPACLNRMYLAEEVQDFEPMRDVSPEPSASREPEDIVQLADIKAAEVNRADDAERALIQALKSKANAIQRELGIKKEEAAEIFEACGRDAAAYVAKLEKMRDVRPTPEGDDFQLENAPAEEPVDLSELVVTLEEYAACESTPAACRADINATLVRGETDVGKLVALLEKAKSAHKQWFTPGECSGLILGGSFMKRFLAFIIPVLVIFSLAGCTEMAAAAQAKEDALTSDAAIARRNLETAEQNFKVFRRVVFYNGITGEYVLTIEGYLSIIKDVDGDIVVTVKTDDGKYLKHYLGLSDNVTYFSEALLPNAVSSKRYNVVFKPLSIAPTIEVK